MGEWKRVTKADRCPICDSDSWCSIGQGVVCCMRIESTRPVKSGGWLHDFGQKPVIAISRKPRKRRESDKELHARWAPIARKAWRGNETASRELACLLGVAPFALEQLCCGWNGSSWTFPERNGYGLIVGISTRYRDGKKLCLPGSRRGLTYSESWADNPGPVLIVEGASDVAAGITLGLATIGRPSNVGGVRYLTRLLGGHPKRRIWVIGERDAKRHETLPAVVRAAHPMRCRGCALCWPGLHGARVVSAALSKALNRRVRWRLLPDDAKDLRAWLLSQRIGPSENIDVYFEAGRRLTKWLG